MWYPAVGVNEVVLTLLICAPFLFFGATGRRMLVGVLPCLILAAAVTPSDIYSMLIVAVPLCLAFGGGVVLSSYIRPAASNG